MKKEDQLTKLIENYISSLLTEKVATIADREADVAAGKHAAARAKAPDAGETYYGDPDRTPDWTLTDEHAKKLQALANKTAPFQIYVSPYVKELPDPREPEKVGYFDPSTGDPIAAKGGKLFNEDAKNQCGPATCDASKSQQILSTLKNKNDTDANLSLENRIWIRRWVKDFLSIVNPGSSPSPPETTAESIINKIPNPERSYSSWVHIYDDKQYRNDFNYGQAAETDSGQVITATDIHVFLPHMKETIEGLSSFLQEKQTDEKGQQKTNLTAKENRIYSLLTDKINEAVSLYHTFAISSKIFTLLISNKEKTTPPAEEEEITLQEAEGPPYKSIELFPDIDSEAARIFEAIDDAQFIKAIPYNKKSLRLTDDISYVVLRVYKHLVNEKKAISIVDPGQATAPILFKRFKLSLDSLRRVRAQVGLDEKEGDKSVVEILSKAYPEWSKDRLDRVASQLENQENTTPENLIKKAKHLRVCDDAFVLMGFATYYYGREMLFPVELGIDVFQQDIFKKFKEILNNKVGRDNWPGDKIFASTNFGDVYSKIPSEIKNYPQTSDRDEETHCDDTELETFLRAVAKNKKLFPNHDELSQKHGSEIISGFAQEFGNLCKGMETEKKNLIPKMVRRFMTGKGEEGENSRTLTAKLVNLFYAINSMDDKVEMPDYQDPPEPPPDPPEPPDPPAPLPGGARSRRRSGLLIPEAVHPDLQQKSDFLSTITGKSSEQISKFIKALSGKPEEKFNDYYKSMKTNLDYSDEQCVALLKHISENSKDLIRMDFDSRISPIKMVLDPESPEEFEDIKEKENQFRAFWDMWALKNAEFGSAWEVKDEKQLFAIFADPRDAAKTSPNDKVAGKAWVLAWRKSGLDTKWQGKVKNLYPRLKGDNWFWKHFKIIYDKVKVAKDKKSPTPAPTAEQKVTTIISSILETILKEENGEKELCN